MMLISHKGKGSVNVFSDGAGGAEAECTECPWSMHIGHFHPIATIGGPIDEAHWYARQHIEEKHS
ncbi:hypothetical protein [Kitasatospora sp. NBC_01302]|uniref:hypothetical protein n=1 Tax=Kitasatospora sp. NBC_01302 TaxID=2903575 RepID=UPI002E143990|nr:hypothetical protein OG294_27795 [Kitasatospora sp. NBC_01302]